VDGTVYTIDTSDTYRTDSNTCAVLRIPHVPAGSASYVFTTSSIVGGVGAIFDYWQWEPAATEGPRVVLIKQPKPFDYTAYGATPPGPPTDAGVDVLNAAFDTLAAEFGARVITVDTSDMDGSTLCFDPGNVHPTVEGHRRLAEIVYTAVHEVISPIPAPQIAARRVEYGTTAPTGTDRVFYVGDRMINTAPVAGGVPGRTCTTGGTPGTWQAEAPLGAVPAWAAYVPTFDGDGGTALGDGTTAAAYIIADGVCDFYAAITLGASTVIGTTVQIGLPVAAYSATSIVAMLGWATDTGSGSFLLSTVAASMTKMLMTTIGSVGATGLVTATVPHTWAATDTIELRGTYRPA
jgi:hypothetical protein